MCMKNVDFVVKTPWHMLFDIFQRFLPEIINFRTMYGILMVVRLKHLEIVLVQRPIFVYGDVNCEKYETEHPTCVFTWITHESVLN